MDEQEQELFITQLVKKNNSQNDLYVKLLYLVPGLGMVPYVLALLSPAEFTPALLLRIVPAMSSLAATVAQLSVLSPPKTGISVLDNINWSPSSVQRWERQEYNAATGGAPCGRTGPLAQYLPVLNLILCILLSLSSLPVFLIGSVEAFSFANIKFYFSLIPLFVYVIVTCAKLIMASVDPATDLERLKYEYKGV